MKENLKDIGVQIFQNYGENSVIWEKFSENMGKYHFITHVLLKKRVLEEFRGLTFQSRGKRGPE